MAESRIVRLDPLFRMTGVCSPETESYGARTYEYARTSTVVTSMLVAYS